MLPQIDINTRSEHNERVRIEVVTEHFWPLGLHSKTRRAVATRNAKFTVAITMQVSVVNGEEYQKKCPVPWQGSDPPTDRDMHPKHQQLHITRYDRKSKKWLPEYEASMHVSHSNYES